MARLTRAERLSRQGVAFVEVDGLLARLTRRQSADPSAYSRAVTAVALAAPLALAMRERVRDKRLLPGRKWPAFGRRPVYFSDAYRQQAGLAKAWYASSQLMHAALSHQKGFFVTGGMWGGLQVRGSGRDSAIIDFGGSSIGRGVNKIERTRKGKTVLVNKPAVVRNSQKAGGIFTALKINVLRPEQSELDTAAAVLVERIANNWAVAAGGDPGKARVTDPRLAGMIRERLSRQGG